MYQFPFVNQTKFKCMNQFQIQNRMNFENNCNLTMLTKDHCKLDFDKSLKVLKVNMIGYSATKAASLLQTCVLGTDK